MEDLKGWFPLLLAAAGALFGAGGTWAVMQFQIRELRSRSKAQDAVINRDREAQAQLHKSHAETLGNHRDRITRLEERHHGLVDKLDDAISSLKAVTGKLEALAITIASGQKAGA